MYQDRFLLDEADVWNQNAWDHVPPPEDQLETIAASLSRQKIAPVPEEEKQKYNDKPARHWCASIHLHIICPLHVPPRDNFYKANSSNFFRNRKWRAKLYDHTLPISDISKLPGFTTNFQNLLQRVNQTYVVLAVNPRVGSQTFIRRVR